MDVIELAAIVAVIFALLSFMNTLGMHLAVRAIRKKTDEFMADPIGAIMSAMHGKMTVPEKKAEMEIVLGWVGKTIVRGAKAELLGVDEKGEPVAGVKPKGILGKIFDLVQVAKAFFPGKVEGLAAAATKNASKIVEDANPGLAEQIRRGEA